MEPEFDIPCSYSSGSPQHTTRSLFTDELDRSEVETDIEGLASQLGDTDLEDDANHYEAVGVDQESSVETTFYDWFLTLVWIFNRRKSGSLLHTRPLRLQQFPRARR